MQHVLILEVANVLLRIILYSAAKVRCSTLGLSDVPQPLIYPYSEREIKIEAFGGRPTFGGRPGALGPMPPLNPALPPSDSTDASIGVSPEASIFLSIQ